MQLFSSRLFSAFLFLLSIVSGQRDGLQTIFDDSAYTKLRPCVQGCFFIRMGAHTTYLRDVLGSKMGCRIVTTTMTTTFRLAENDCFCRADLQSSAHAEIYKCVESRCNQNQNDVSSANAMYDGYCVNNGYDFASSGVITTAENVPVPTNAAPVTKTTGSKPTWSPERSAARSVRIAFNAFLFILISIVSCSHVRLALAPESC